MLGCRERACSVPPLARPLQGAQPSLGLARYRTASARASIVIVPGSRSEGSKRPTGPRVPSVWRAQGRFASLALGAHIRLCVGRARELEVDRDGRR